jgi:hypothetical protein
MKECIWKVFELDSNFIPRRCFCVIATLLAGLFLLLLLPSAAY